MSRTIIRVSEDILENINSDVTDEAEEIAQNVAVLMATPIGNVPLERGMGISNRYKDRLPKTARAMFRAEITEQMDQYEPRAEVNRVIGEVDSVAKDYMKLSVEVELNDGG